MTKQDYILIADTLRPVMHDCGFDSDAMLVVNALCDAFARDNHLFKRSVFIGYLKGECGPSGGKVKA